MADHIWVVLVTASSATNYSSDFSLLFTYTLQFVFFSLYKLQKVMEILI